MNAAAPIALALLAGAASAQTASLYIYEDADFANPTLDMTVSIVADASNVSFTFANNSPESPVITQVYFEAGAILAGLGAGGFDTGSNDVLFAAGNGPANPAGLASAGFWGDAWSGTGAAYGALPSPIAHGIATGELGTFTFANAGGYTAQGLLDAILADEFRIAAHVQSVSDGASSVWVVTPAPASSVLLAMIGGLAARRRR